MEANRKATVPATPNASLGNGHCRTDAHAPPPQGPKIGLALEVVTPPTGTNGYSRLIQDLEGKKRGLYGIVAPEKNLGVVPENL